jgi:hypothetical protein
MPRLRTLLSICVFLSSLYNGPSLVKSITSLARREAWTGLHVHDLSTRIRDALVREHLETNRRIATLAPLFVVESGMSIYRELSTGPFLYRIGDLLTEGQRAEFIATSPGSIGALLDGDPPVAIVVGLEGNLDEPLVEYAKRRNYQSVEVAGFDGDLYVNRTLTEPAYPLGDP